MKAYAPVALFIFKRPQHTQRTLESLMSNPELERSPFVVFCDAARNESEAGAVQETRDLVKKLAPRHTKFVERDKNFGLAKSIISGVTDLVTEFGTAIVIEDDMVLSSTALRYFNQALDVYAASERVMHVSGYSLPLHSPMPPLYFFREATCWGWATWARAWKHFNFDSKNLVDTIKTQGLVNEFNTSGSEDYMGMLELQANGQLDSWAIRWYASIFLQKGLSLHPGRSLVNNIGCDGTGVHCEATDEYDVEISDLVFKEFPKVIEETPQSIEAILEHRSEIRKQRLARANPPRAMNKWARFLSAMSGRMGARS